MVKQLNSFQETLQAAQSRTDLSALTSATSLGATIAAAQTKGRPAATRAATAPTVNTVMVAPTSAAATPAATTPAATTDPGNPGFTDMAAQLKAISDRIDQLKTGTLTLPSNINTFTTKAGTAGVGIEPTISLDEQSRYINHLHELRRVNSGDDRTDMAGYGLYLLRMPISLLPGPESRKGKGAVVTVEARHDLTDDLLENIYRDVAILGLTYVLTQLVNEDIHLRIAEKCHPPTKSKTPKRSPISTIDALKNVAGPNPNLLEDLRIILGPLDLPTTQEVEAEQAMTDGGTDLSTEPPPMLPSDPTNSDQPALKHPSVPEVDALPRLGLSQTKQSGRGLKAKRDAVIKTSISTVQFSSPAGERWYRRILSNRWRLIDQVVEHSQRDPFRHDPSTLTLFQAALLDVHRYMRQNADKVDLFQVPKIEAIGELLDRRDYMQLKLAREQFLRELYCYRNGLPLDFVLPPTWTLEVEPSDVLAFALLLQFVNVDRQLKRDMKTMAMRRGGNWGDVDGLYFYDFQPTIEARTAFKEYVACKWPLHGYSVDPVLDQQNVLDAFSRRTELQLALAVAVSTGQFNIKNATSFARQLDLDLQTVGLNRTSVGFGAGATTFGWMFYPRVQTPPSTSNFRTITNTLTGTGQGINFDLRNRRIEPGQHECIALMVTPNFIPSLRIATVTNWFDVTGHHAKRQLDNRDMLELSRKLQQAKSAVMRACDSHEYRATDFTVLNERIKQLEALLPTQDTRVDLPDEGDLLGSEIFSSNAAGLSPSLLAWYGEPVQDGTVGSIFLQGHGFNVSETQVIVGGVALQRNQFRLISRNVMQIIVPPMARSVKATFGQEHLTHAPQPAPKTAVASITPAGVPPVTAMGGVAEVGVDSDKAHAELDPKLGSDVTVSITKGPTTANAHGSKVDLQVDGVRAHAEAAAAVAPDCDRAVMDVHIATPNGISNHLFVEVVPKTKLPDPKPLATTATTTTVVNGNTTTTTTKFETTPPGIYLPPLTVLPMGAPLPATTVLAPGSVTGVASGSAAPGLIPPTPVATPLTPTLDTPTPRSRPSRTRHRPRAGGAVAHHILAPRLGNTIRGTLPERNGREVQLRRAGDRGDGRISARLLAPAFARRRRRVESRRKSRHCGPDKQ